MKKLLLMLLLASGLVSCKKDNNTQTPEDEFFVNEDASTFSEIASFKVGGAGAAEISAFDPSTNRLFVVNNNSTENRIDVIDFKDPANMSVIKSIPMLPYGGAVNSLSVSGGNVAAAIESVNKQANGKVVVFKSSDYTKVAEATVGALPDMVTYTPDGKFILTANEGEPSADYINDPEGSISIISVENNYAVKTITFGAFAGQKDALAVKGFRVFGPSNDFVKDIEPEYITVSEDSKTAWVTLQENNGIAKVDLATQTITQIFPLGFKDYSVDGNEIDPSDRDSKVGVPSKWPVKGIYMPDAIAVFTNNNTPYLFTANEGDAREYSNVFVEAKRVKDIVLNPAVFPNATDLRKDEQLGRLNITSTLGMNAEGKYDALYSFGARSFSVWNGNTGAQVFDSKNELDAKAVAAGIYDDSRSDDKSIEPEGLTIGKIGRKTVAFVGMERIDAVAIYDVTDPAKPSFLQMIKCGDAPEGVLIIPASKSPTKKSLLVVSSEDDGVVKVFTPKTI
ncbi:choice-of-anchor I family protein [uncultured Mucilaginibacter sp.]|uniref:choice-of-anchor I family protein n=1 Tax=uncultured Mucilaginibacter sp. TaxID=797541 RepID=UPI0025F65680|nr:choice-of-anchor I family protein [uncultured Mucilaginibacter sp.]